MNFRMIRGRRKSIGFVHDEWTERLNDLEAGGATLDELDDMGDLRCWSSQSEDKALNTCDLTLALCSAAPARSITQSAAD